jgi:predicted metal-dependent hydrolase
MQLSFPFDFFLKSVKSRGSGRRSIQLGDGLLDYALERRRGRTISIHVKESGVSVRAPRWTPLHEIEGFVREKADWIRKRVVELESRPREFAWHDGSKIDLFGSRVVIRVIQESGRSRTCVTLANNELWVSLKEGDAETRLREHIVAWLRREALTKFRVRAHEYSGRLNLPPPNVALSNAKGRWGSCSSKSGIRLSWRLALLPEVLANYVIAHEIAHLVHMNHSPRFWAVVEQLHPDCKASRRELRQHERTLSV